VARGRCDFQKAAQCPLDENARYVSWSNRGVLRVRQERFEKTRSPTSSRRFERKPGALPGLCQTWPRPYRRLDKLDSLSNSSITRRRASIPRSRTSIACEPASTWNATSPPWLFTTFDQAIGAREPRVGYQADDQVERGRLLLGSGKFALALASFDAALAGSKRAPAGPAPPGGDLVPVGPFRRSRQGVDHYLEGGKPQESVYRAAG